MDSTKFGRKFITCKFYNRDSGMRGCGFFIWVEEDYMTGWQRNIINDLLTENRSLKRELRQTRKKFEEIAKEVDGEKLKELKEDLVELKIEASNVPLTIFIQFRKTV
ncbi:hypothetical protein RND81_07G019000 [Saponaria officinalis]|uniref:Zinc finger GRF-type domain-containing protein n=1 Tax=Saponaria officinalis TaxID=3572 RepID=A0AAW1JK61_SAPOF